MAETTIPLIPNDYHYYQPLDPSKKAIRLLAILPASDTENLTCVLVRSNLAANSFFQTLSYCWGDLHDTLPIKLVFAEWIEADFKHTSDGLRQPNHPVYLGDLQGTNVVDNFMITRNLHTALGAFQETFGSRGAVVFVWADMLCINQGNLEERSHQVSIMHQIYQAAPGTTVWLGGDPNVESDLLLGTDADITRFNTVIGGVDLQPLLERFWSISEEEYTYAKEHMAMIRRTFNLPDRPSWVDDSNGSDYHVETFISWLHLEIPTDIQLHPRYPPSAEEFIGYLRRIIEHDSLIYQYVRYQYLELALRTGQTHRLNIDELRQSPGETRDIWPLKHCFDLFKRLEVLFSLPWFRRIWVVQEIAFSSIVFVRHGKTLIWWEDIQQLVHLKTNLAYYLEFKDTHTVHHIKKTALIYAFKLKASSIWAKVGGSSKTRVKQRLVELISEVSEFHSTVPRDKLFAIYHLPVDIPNLEFRVDYSGPVEEVYKSFTLAVIQKQNSARILSLAGLPSKRLDMLPSWVPNYHDLGQKRNIDILESYHACGSRPMRRFSHLRSDTLTLQGVQVSRVAAIIPLHVLKSLLQDQTSASNWSTISIEKLWTMSSVMYSWLFDGDEKRCLDVESSNRPTFCLDAFVDALGSFVIPLLESEPDILGHGKEHFQKVLIEQWRREDNKLEMPKSSLSDQLMLRKLAEKSSSTINLRGHSGATDVARSSLNQGNMLFFSYDGKLGICPATTLADDTIVNIDGFNTPLILRPKPQPVGFSRAEAVRNGEIFELIGPCWYPGVMEGEIYQSPHWNDHLHEDPLDVARQKVWPGEKQPPYLNGILRIRPFNLV